ncbi:MAG: sensor histidine kinase [Chloroflexi bacterium]|nr:sensor histidine kinase [Chloroflexota bacterium]
MPKRTFNLLSISTYVIVFAVGIPMLIAAFATEDPDRWLIAGLYAALVVLLIADERSVWPHTDLMNHTYMAISTILVTSLAILDPNIGPGIILFFMLSSQATTLFPWRTGLIWLGIFTFITGIVLFIGFGGPEGLLILPIYGAGYAFFAVFANQTREAIEAQNESERLYHELQQAHAQLRNYAEQVEELTIIEERNRLAREMHDTVGHRLTVSAVHLEAAQRLIPDNPEKASTMVETVRGQITEALTELRQAVAALRAPVEEDLSLINSLQRLATQFEQGTGITVQLELPEDFPPLEPKQRQAMYRAAQETLTNVQRHSQAQHVWLQLQVQNDSLILYISDDGIGVPPDLQPSGFGLKGLSERATQLGGNFHLAPRPDGGTQATFHIPIIVEPQ